MPVEPEKVTALIDESEEDCEEEEEDFVTVSSSFDTTVSFNYSCDFDILLGALSVYLFCQC